jgi:F0F1-type ATP synthase membrane subunit b/b'
MLCTFFLFPFPQHAYVKELELLKNELEQILSTARARAHDTRARATHACKSVADEMCVRPLRSLYRRTISARILRSA